MIAVAFWPHFAVALAAGYALGSIPVGVLIARSRGVNLRQHGSGNVGATNVGRVCGKKWGYVCFALDVLKGFAPVLVAGTLLRRQGPSLSQAQQLVWIAAGLGAILGHVFSGWLGFRGGKGVATSLGVLLGFWPILTVPGLVAFGLWIAVTLTWRYVSLGSVAAAAAFPLLLVAWLAILDRSPAQTAPLIGFAAAMSTLVIVRHRGNIRRLLAGTENKIRGKT